MCRRSEPRGQVLHRDVRQPVRLEVVVHGDDVGVAEGARQPGLAQEPLRERGLGGAEDAELLERDDAVEVDLPRDVDGGHAAAADFAADLVAPDAPRRTPAWVADAAHLGEAMCAGSAVDEGEGDRPILGRSHPGN